MIVQHFTNFWWIGGVEHYLMALAEATPDCEHRIHSQYSTHPEAIEMAKARGLSVTCKKGQFPFDANVDLIVNHSQGMFAPSMPTAGRPVLHILHGWPTTHRCVRRGMLNASVNQDGANFFNLEQSSRLPALGPSIATPTQRKTAWAASGALRIGTIVSPRAEKLSAQVVPALNILHEAGIDFTYYAVGLQKIGEERFRKAKFRFELLPCITSVEEKYKYLCSLDVGYYSVSCVEGFGIAVQEMLAVGLPVVADNRGGICDQIQHRLNGVLTTHPHDAAMYLCMFAGSEKLRGRFGRKAMEVIDTAWTYHAFAQKFYAAREEAAAYYKRVTS